ncbi:MAG TPA: chromosome segregation protein SMC [Anaerolineales bacterium]|nr:chromosome segregation protein SMC [Anaerolineales bacterium]
MSTNGRGRPRLKALDLQGYKTFASKSMFEFASTITAIVGPNGSGKSNIADAIRWVLGEQSYSLLRGKRTEDMIFSGSEQRARAGMAAATITFDNSDGWLPIDFSEVTIGRRAYRDGENEYLINGQRVRLREVAELLARCGLGERTYTIIGQGLVDAALSLKAEERRRLFEEAAGIGLYRSRREETLRRLDQTRRNLDRVQDILAELRPRLRSLERQARRAQDFEQVRNDLHAALRTWYGYHWYRLTDVLARARSEAEQQGAQRDSLRAREEQADRDLTAARLRIDALRAGLQRNAQHVSAAYRERETLGRRQAVSEERLRWLDEQAAALEAEEKDAAESRAALAARVEAGRADVAERKAALDEATGQWNDLLSPSEGSAAPAGATLESLAADRAAAAARLESLTQQTRAVAADIDRLQVELRTATEAEDRATDESKMRQAEIGKAEAARRAAAEARDRTLADQARLEKERDEAGQHAMKRRGRMESLEARWESQRESLEASSQLKAALKQAAGEGQLRWEGEMRSALRVPPELRRAIEAALGPFADGFGFASEADIDAGMRLVEANPLDAPTALVRLDGPSAAPRPEALVDPDCLGNAVDLVEVAPAYRRAVESILGRTWIVRSRAAARRLAGRLAGEARLVTLQGEVFHPEGHVLLRASRAKGEGAGAQVEQADVEAARREAASADDQVRALEAQLASARSQTAAVMEAFDRATEAHHRAQTEHAQAHGRFVAAGERVIFLRSRLEALTADRNELLERSAEEQRRVDEIQTAYGRLEVEIKRADLAAGGEAGAVHRAQAEAHLQLTRGAFEDAQARAAELEAGLKERLAEQEARRVRREAMEQERSRLQAELADAARGLQVIEEKLQALTAESAPAEGELTTTEQTRATLEQEEAHLRADVQAAERRHAQAQIELARREEELSSLQRRIEDDFGLVAFDFDESATVQGPLPIEGLVEHLPRIEALPLEQEAQVNRLRLQLRRMGAINPEAQREYLEVKERVEFLSTQLTDLRKAEGQLQSVIAELDELMEQEFKKTFEAVGAEFRLAFTRLFGGGSVRLSLTDPEDLTMTGIDIEARLPGRREQGLSMLSGGERSLTACALVFALLKVSPTPFCVLDEVDAMLDESNVARFREMLHELSAETQFIVITHNRQTVQAADVIYGVSMGADSASRVISLRLDEAEREMAA